MNFATLEQWQGNFDVTDMMDLSRWEKYRQTIRHPATLFTQSDIQRAQHNIHHHDWAKNAYDTLQARVSKLGKVTAKWASTYIPKTTPGSPHFTMCPKCEFAPMHGAYDWSPDAPEHIRCKGCGTVYPNAEYPEDIIFQSQYDPNQTITYYGGKSWSAYGYDAIHSSFSGHARIHQCRYAANAIEDLALTYALTGDKTHARAVATLLKRFADVHPNYLVHSSYGEYADMEPRLAATQVTHLPQDEWCPPGNVPNRILHPGYWATLRWGSSGGMEGTSLQKLILAYDLIANTLTDTERKHIEKNLLLDAAVMLFSNEVINNKTGMNRCAVGLIGMVCGDPLLVRFGLDGFVRAVRDWWLPDGGTPESNGYASMMLHGIWRLAEALKHYRDPEDIDLAPGRLSGMNLYEWPRYRAIWQGMARPLLPNFDYPRLADNRLPCHLSAMLADVLTRNYPTPNHQAYQQHIAQIEQCYAGRIAQFWFGGNLDSSAAFYRTPVTKKPSAPIFHNDLGPHLKIGTLRTGKRGQTSTINLSASDWVGHHHHDHLNLFYWKNGQEWLTDLGYLWDMQELGRKTRRTLAHNLVMVNEAEQESKERNGTFTLFHTEPNFKIMQASSNATEESFYQRTIAVIGNGTDEYIIDIFRVKGGQTHDWIMHGPNQNLQISNTSLTTTAQTIYDLTNIQTDTPTQSWTASWKAGRRKFQVHVPQQQNATIYVGQGFGQRKAHDQGQTIPYIVRRRTSGPSVFVTVYAENKIVDKVTVPFLDPKTLTTVIDVKTPKGTDRLISKGPGKTLQTLQVGRQKIIQDAPCTFLSKTGLTTMIGGTQFKMGKCGLQNETPVLKGTIIDTFLNTHESGLITRGDLTELSQLIGQHIFVTESHNITRTYPVLGIAQHNGQAALITRRGNEGYDIQNGKTWFAWRIVSQKEEA